MFPMIPNLLNNNMTVTVGENCVTNGKKLIHNKENDFLRNLRECILTRKGIVQKPFVSI